MRDGLTLRRLADCWDFVRVPLNAEERSHRPGDVPYWGANSIQGYVDQSLLNEPVVLIGEDGAPFFDRDRPVAFSVDGPIWPNNHIHVLKPHPGVDARWLAYALNDVDYAQYIIGSTRDKLTQASLMSIKLPWASREQQTSIADYLDRETAQIDTLISEQERLIDLLRERTKVVIEEAVFGVGAEHPASNEYDWLPDLPAHWSVPALGQVADTLAGLAFPSDGFSSDVGNTPLLRGVNVKPMRIDWSESVYWDDDVSAVPEEYRLLEGDLVFGMDRPFVGSGVRVAPVTSGDLPAFLLQRVMRVRASGTILGGYLDLLMRTDAFRSYLEPLFTGVSVPHVSEWQVRKFRLPLPPLAEQQEIADTTTRTIAKLADLVAEAERLIELAKERRSALITAAVTGQIEIPEAS